MQHEASPDTKNKIRSIMLEMPKPKGNSKTAYDEDMTPEEHKSIIMPLVEAAQRLLDMVESIDDIDKLRKAVSKLKMVDMMEKMMGGTEEEDSAEDLDAEDEDSGDSRWNE